MLVNWNFFAEKHGKSDIDGHFSCISKFIKDKSLTKQLSSSHDVIEEIEERQKVANTRRTELGLFLNLFNPKYKIFYMNLIYVINILRKN